MYQENEIISLLLFVYINILFLVNLKVFKTIFKFNVLYSAFVVYSIGYVFTVIEGFLFPVLFNIFEHFCYLLGLGIFLIWIINYYNYSKHDE